MAQNNVDYVKGVFSTQEIKKIGTGTTTRKTVQKTYWFVESIVDDPEGKLECQPLNSNFVPSGAKTIISRDELMERFAPEPEFYMSSVFPKMRELQHKTDLGDAHRNKGENFSAENEYSGALAIDEENVRANFGIGLTYLQRGEPDKAQNIFERLLRLDGTFEVKHKHLFNEFGISLRKNALLDEAIAYYERALEMTDHDENLLINLARTYLEKKDYYRCTEFLLQALSDDPNHVMGLKFLEWMQKHSLIPAQFAGQTAKFIKNT